MSTAIYSNAACFLHENGSDYHPETSARLDAILNELTAANIPGVKLVDIPSASFEKLTLYLLRVHTQDYIETLYRKSPQNGFFDFTPDTAFSAHTLDAALGAISCVVSAVDEIKGNKFRNIFCAVRPPGHHAERDVAIGTCFFNNVAVGAAYACELGFKVAIIDIDAHHGNGTQSWAESHPDVLFCSSHEDSRYPPFLGHADDHGPHNNIMNVPLPSGATSEMFRAKMTSTILKKLSEFRPDIIFVSCGGDAHSTDPFATLLLHENDYGWMASQLSDICPKTISVLEGGYDSKALARVVREYVMGLEGKTDFPITEPAPKETPSQQQMREWLEAARVRLEKGIPANLHLAFAENAINRHYGGDFSLIGINQSEMSDLWKSNLVCHNLYLGTALEHAMQNEPLLAEEVIRYSFLAQGIMRFFGEAEKIEGLDDYMDLGDPSAADHYARIGTKYKEDEKKSAAFLRLAEFARVRKIEAPPYPSRHDSTLHPTKTGDACVPKG